jgi:hypothetical protein
MRKVEILEQLSVTPIRVHGRMQIGVTAKI